MKKKDKVPQNVQMLKLFYSYKSNEDRYWKCKTKHCVMQNKAQKKW